MPAAGRATDSLLGCTVIHGCGRRRGVVYQPPCLTKLNGTLIVEPLAAGRLELQPPAAAAMHAATCVQAALARRTPPEYLAARADLDGQQTTLPGLVGSGVKPRLVAALGGRDGAGCG